MPVTVRTPLPRVLHLSADFPDTVEAFKTPVIKSHLDLTDTEFSHDVISINRRSPGLGDLLFAILKGGGRPKLLIEAASFQYGTALTYHAPGRGLFHATMLRQIGCWIADRIEPASRPDLLVGHKLGFEGIAIAEAARLTGIPYALSIQGDSDTKVLSARPDLAGELAKAFHEAAVVFPFSPWALRAVEQKLGRRERATLLLPCPTDLDEPQIPVAGGAGMITTFHLKNHRRKNLDGIAKAFHILEAKKISPGLQVIGGGSPAELQQCEAVTAGLKSVSYTGPMQRMQLRNAMSTARGFIMPSLRESFGLVFIEALFAGLPVVYPAGTAVDGFLDNLPFALRVDARDAKSIAAAIETLDREEAILKHHLADWLRSKDARRFTRAAIARQFATGLRMAIADR